MEAPFTKYFVTVKQGLVVPAKKRSKLKTALLKVLLLGFSVVFTCLIAEVVLRFVHPPRQTQLEPQVTYTKAARDLEKSRPVGYFHVAPNQTGYNLEAPVTSNSLGIRNREVGPKGADSFRIVALGDSHTFGFAVEETKSWPRLLETKLRARYQKRKCEVINGGIGGLAIEQEIQLFKDLILPLEPDLVLLAYYWNDMPMPGRPLEAWPEDQEMIAPSMKAPRTTPRPAQLQSAGWIDAIRGLLKKSYLIYWVVQRIPALQMSFYPSNVTEWKRMTLEGKSSTRVDAAWKFVHSQLAELKRLGTEHNFQVNVIVIPLFEQMVTTGYSDEQYQGRLRSACDALNLSLIDPLDSIRSAKPTYPEFFIPFDGHPNGKVYEPLAEEVSRHILENILGAVRK